MSSLQETILVDPDPEVAAEKAIELLGVTMEQVLAELHYRRQQREAKCRREMVAAARAGRERRILRGEGGGEVEMMIHPYSYHYWGQRLGYPIWDDPTFRREYLRDNDAARVRSRSDRVTIVNDFTGTHSAPNRRGVRGKRGRWAA